ncbi:hypothetical protein C8A03DRAFT_47975 [Achaetomium macrosporum]|uniref:2EXR domain-containing protein n=1 Tax=Achaetomium macrosporum TaxID=79813 RepID=A0AAN7C2V4_9PEZI|nr:hypothetical protein C8A03DRAFT_47975 [Achaetomium macrosporum]
MATFHPFPRLPFELRAQIWEMSVEPRTVEVRIVYGNRHLQEGPRLLTFTPVPAILQTCREARSLGLYQRAFTELPINLARRYVWVNFEIDIISIGKSYFEGFEPVAPLIKRIKFERQRQDEVFFHWESRDIESFVNLREIHVVSVDGFWGWHGASKDHYWPCGNENVICFDPYENRVMRLLEMEELYDKLEEKEERQDSY